MTPHPYSVYNTRKSVFEKKEVYFKLIVNSSVLSGIISYALSTFSGGFQTTVLFFKQNLTFATAAIGVPSTIAIYQTILKLVDNCFWKNIIGRMLGIDTPDLSGRWNGDVYFKDRDGKEVVNNSGLLKIKQTWCDILVEFNTDVSQSYSKCAFIEISDGLIVLKYEYEASRSSLVECDIVRHRGFSRLEIYIDKRNNDCDKILFYTENKEAGTILLKKI